MVGGVRYFTIHSVTIWILVCYTVLCIVGHFFKKCGQEKQNGNAISCFRRLLERIKTMRQSSFSITQRSFSSVSNSFRTSSFTQARTKPLTCLCPPLENAVPSKRRRLLKPSDIRTAMCCDISWRTVLWHLVKPVGIAVLFVSSRIRPHATCILLSHPFIS